MTWQRKGVVLALDLGGTKVEAALVTPDGSILSGTRYRADTGGTASAADLAEAITTVVRLSRDSAGSVSILGVGVAAPGPIDDANGYVVPINLSVLEGVPLRAVVASAANVQEEKVEFRRDGVAFILAEYWLGAAQGADSALGIVISTGVGGGLIINGRALVGNAGHIGQVEVSGLVGDECLGRTTMLESVASGPNIVAWARREGFDGSTGEDLAAAYAVGNHIAVRAVQRCASAVGQAIGSAVALLPVGVVVIGGGFSRVSDDLVPLIADEVGRHPLPYVAATPVVPAVMKNDAPLVGAAALVYRSDLLPSDPG
ncbi:MAG: ROK family protein [Gordonia sp. (in: high G+C Gram-positive bacteria)]